MIIGEIFELVQHPEFGNEFGTVYCPQCGYEMVIEPMSDAPKCACGLEWSIEVRAVGREPGE